MAETEDLAMPEAEYQAVLSHCRMLAQIVETNEVLTRVPAAIEVAERSDTLAPFVDPTLWMRGHASLKRDIALMRACQTFQAEVRKAMA